MIRIRKSTMGAAAGLAALMLLPAPGFAAAAGEHDHAHGAAAVQKAPENAGLAHMGEGAKSGGANMTGSGMMGSGMMSSGMMGSGMMGSGKMGSGMMSPAMMNPCMMGSGTMSPSMMRPGMMGSGMMAPGNERGHGIGMGSAAGTDEGLSAEDVRAGLDRSLAWHGNKRLEVGEVSETGDGVIVAEIVTKDGALVRRFGVDRRTGQMRDVE